jgi:hypothetical protein
LSSKLLRLRRDSKWGDQKIMTRLQTQSMLSYTHCSDGLDQKLTSFDVGDRLKEEVTDLLLLWRSCDASLKVRLRRVNL